MRNIIERSYSAAKGNKKSSILFLLSFFVLVIFSFVYLGYTWDKSMSETSKQALNAARIAEAGLNGETLHHLKGVKEDVGTIEYESMKKRLFNLVGVENGIRFAYIYTQRDDKIYFMVDSESAFSTEYSPAGQEITQGTPIFKKAFAGEASFITPPITDRWGTWITVLSPMEYRGTGETIGVLAMDYPAKTWTDNARNETVQAGMTVAALFLVLFAFYIIFNKNIMLKEVNIIIKKSEEKFSKAFHSNGALMAISSVEEGLYLDVNETFLETLAFKREEVIGKNLTDSEIFSDQKQREKLKIDFENNINIRNIEVKIKGKDDRVHSCLLSVDKIAIGVTPCWITMMIDITEHKLAEEKILYLSYHDQLTGLYNRRFYEEELKRLDTGENLPLTIVMGDVNGLKLTNDTFGHDVGDELLKKIAEVIKNGCRPNDIIARIGGDEFVILFPKTDAYEVEQIIKRIDDLLTKEKVALSGISISFGYETKNHEEEKIQEIFKKAEDYMYQRKLSQKLSTTGTTINDIFQTLHGKNHREQLHCHRVSQLCERMGQAIELNDYEIIKLKMIAILHDIGKIEIDENILNKKGKLTEHEWEEIKRHSEIGYRIINSVNDMSDMAGCVLAHHERWDGKGYPKGLKKEEIPIMSRIIAIVDAYEAMTSERSYRKAFSQEVALKELQKNAGTQFDPELVTQFIEKVLRP